MLSFFVSAALYVGLIWSVLAGVSQTSFFGSWVCLELNMLMFVAVLNSSEGLFSVSMKYFIVQGVGSSVFLWSTGLGVAGVSDDLVLLFSMMALGLKLGVAPLHSWFIGVLSMMGWELILLASTVQKILPVYLLSNISYSGLSVFILVSAIVSVSGSLSQAMMKKILGYSSVFMTAWVLASEKNFSAGMEYLLAYSLALALLIFLMAGSPYTQVNEILSSLSPGLSLIFMSGLWSMGGCPPLVGFYAKISMISVMLGANHFCWLSFLVVSSVFLLFVYMRIFYFSLSLVTPQSLAGELKVSASALLPFLGLTMLLPWWLRVGVSHSKFWTFSY